MSRFGLRSSSDIFKASEEQANGKKVVFDTKAPSKRSCQRKNNYMYIENDVKSNETCYQKGENKNPVSIVCSLPLNRLTGFLEKLKTKRIHFEIKNQYSFSSSHSEDKVLDETTGTFCENGPQQQEYYERTISVEENVRILCLFCDKKFTSYKMQLKHVDKFHIQNKNRRCSGRNSNAASVSDSRKQRVESGVVVTAEYPGCIYCKRSKTHTIEAPTKELDDLFFHFVDSHPDKYFGCKSCMQRFPNSSKLTQHMHTIHKDALLLADDSTKGKDCDLFIVEKDLSEKYSREKGKSSKLRSTKLQKNVNDVTIPAPSPENSASTSSNIIMGAEEPILSRLGLVQNRLPNNRKGVRSRKDNVLSDTILSADHSSVYVTAVKARNKSGRNAIRESGDAEIIFRMPTRTEMLSSVFDENFYKDVVSNVRNNLLHFLDGKVMGNVASASSIIKLQTPTIKSTLVDSPIFVAGCNAVDSEIHAATSLTTSTAFPTLLTAEQYGGDAVLSKIRRPHTKHSWKWKWDSVKKFKLINEGGKIVKKMKQPILGLRDLSKLDMWTQLSMRQKHELRQYMLHSATDSNGNLREEKQRINEQLNYILDMRLLPHIILEQNEQAIIKIENDEFGIVSYIQNTEEDRTFNESFVDEHFFSTLQLSPILERQYLQQQVVLSGEWARPRCYLCMCCGSKFEKLKSLEEHKMFRHSHVLSAHYEVVGRELLAGNSLRHLFIPNRALGYYGNDSYFNTNNLRKSVWKKNDLVHMNRRMITGSAVDDESSDSVPSTLNSCKHSAITDECDTDTKTTLDITTASPSNSMQSSNSLLSAPSKMQRYCKETTITTAKCSKCTRRCNGTLDLYRHMLDCSGDYIWSMAKKRKYRYYCGSKKRRSSNKHHFAELRRNPPKISKPSLPSNDTEESASSSKVKTPSRQRPSDAESIKKMLENLPPKRICKKIFPALTKTKKAKFITKHKMFSSQGRLRSTRARQISKLSKNKRKFCNQSIKSKNRMHLKNEKLLVKRKSKNLLKIDESVNTVSENSERENFRNLQNTNNNDINSQKIVNDCNDSNMNKSKQPPTSTKVPINVVENADQQTKTPEQNCNINTESRICDSLRSSRLVQQTDSQKEAPSDTLENYECKSSFQCNDGITCNKKRSKKINDCIAMLTGKLEEKLKTEQNSLNNDEARSEKCINSGRLSGEVKPPKRKTLSRKIIKVDSISSDHLTVVTPNISKVSCPPTEVNTIPTKVVTVPILTTLKSTDQNNLNINYLPNTENVTILLENGKCPVMNKQVTPFNSGNMEPALSLLPPISMASPNANVLLPKKPTSGVIVEKTKKAQPPVAKPNVISESILPFPTLPHALPLQTMKVNPSPIVPLIQQAPVLRHPTLLPTPVVPVAPMVPMVTAIPLFNSEPLNLSNTKNEIKQNVTETIGLPTYRSGLPIRRQTICGFEARNFLFEDEPLDLSKKSNPAQEVPIAVSHMPITHNIQSIDKNMTIVPHHDLVNKQFYSNLELLKIPQIRNPGSSNSCEPPVINAIPKCSSKKRSGAKNNSEFNSKSVATNNSKCNIKETTTSKKENLAKGKSSQKMDEEVINHIDDAINSVINAVKASLPDNDEDSDGKSNNINKNLNHTLPVGNHKNVNQMEFSTSSKLITTKIVPSNLPLVNTFQSLQKRNDEPPKSEANDVLSKSSLPVPQKRCVRSKTLDSRPSALTTTLENLSDSLHLPQQPVPDRNVIVNKIEINKNASNVKCLPVNDNFSEGILDTPIINCKSKNSTNEFQNIGTVLCSKTNNDSSVPSKLHTTEQYLSIAPSELHNKTKKCVSPVVEASTTVSINPNVIIEENMSNINNTSSGFHSSGQIDNTVEATKKQRRRRKNELAAIVADQLLESFKIDKARRDNLKKLENLAYEKSEDLFVTGMLLMSSTKRNVTCSKTGGQFSYELNSNKNSECRQKQNQNNTRSNKVKCKQEAINNRTLKAPENAIPDSSSNREEKSIVGKKSKRKQYRSKGKPLDNDNIIKLKSSLESFSIGIEKQLTELEARNSIAAMKDPEKKPLNTSPTSMKQSILRPSILSANMEPNINMHRTPSIETKSTVFSRDPRLNKNIHKNNQNEFPGTRPCEKNLDEIGDVEEDNYLTEIAKNVNEKIMSSENEEFMFVNDGFELANELQDDSNSKLYSRPPTSMSVRSAPNFNDDRSNFGSICDENTNTEVMDMDLEDELSVYTSYSQDVGRSRGRRRRRRKSILLKRRPKKRIIRDVSEEKFECTLCKKSFYTVNSLTKHNMTLAHVSKLSAQEYLLSKALEHSPTTSTPNVSNKAKESISMAITDLVNPADIREIHKTNELNPKMLPTDQHREQMINNTNGNLAQEVNDNVEGKDSFNNMPRINLNPDERLFFECCNILKGTEAAAVNNSDDHNDRAGFQYSFQDKTHTSIVQSSCLRSLGAEIPKRTSSRELIACKPSVSQQVFRSPSVHQATIVNKVGPTVTSRDQHRSSPNYSPVSQFSAVTNATSRFKTKAAMKGYENINIDLAMCKEVGAKSIAVCKLTELAEIALGNEKSNNTEFTSISNQPEGSIFRQLPSREFVTSSVAVDNPRQTSCDDGNRERIKNNEVQSSTSSKTIMHSSKIKSVAEENSKEACRKIVIPERPFKNIGLEEKETITFQKPKTSINLLTDDNSVSITSYSDRDDFDFASLSCDDEPSTKVNKEKSIKDNSDSSSSRATAKTFENKSLIMDRIFKNMGTKAKKTQNIGIQKDHSSKADINQLFDELRGDCGPKSVRSSESISKKNTCLESFENVQFKQRQTNVQNEQPLPNNSGLKETRKKSNVNVKSQKEITRLQSELGMSQEEVVKLINEGQRKSKRRCATIRPKKLVEMWSSDEYEEFLSTKDIIALIEEKEKQETRKKRKVGQQLNTCSSKNNEIEIPKPITDRRKSVRCINEKEEPVAASSEVFKKRCGKTNGITKPQSNRISMKSSESKEKYSRCCTMDESGIKLKNSISRELDHKIVNRKKRSLKGSSETVVSKSLILENGDKKSSKMVTAKCTKDMQPEKEKKTDYLSKLKQTNCRTRSSKERKPTECKEIVKNSKTTEERVSGAVENKKHIDDNNHTHKNRRRNQTNPSPPRRKRLASEKLYYWSSSSDEDFGKINSTCAPEFDGGENYQKHGWIVGDSHKKLVTLLAIAKGNKKVDNSCGVKKNNSRKKIC
uniref:C2H2-type domain-containing protein n=1 Tax=Ceratitis capitata TaxID=7213 RepID=W8AD72_CERCA